MTITYRLISAKNWTRSQWFLRQVRESCDNITCNLSIWQCSKDFAEYYDHLMKLMVTKLLRKKKYVRIASWPKHERLYAAFLRWYTSSSVQHFCPIKWLLELLFIFYIINQFGSFCSLVQSGVGFDYIKSCIYK